MSGAKGRSGRRRKATAQFRGETWVRLSMADCVSVLTSDEEIIFTVTHPNIYTPEVTRDYWTVNGRKFTDFAAARDEFLRRVNG